MHEVVTVPSSFIPELFSQVCSCGYHVIGSKELVTQQRAGHIDPAFAGH